MIESEFTKVENFKKEVDFPVLAKSSGKDAIPMIVLFTSKKCGTCLWSQDDSSVAFSECNQVGYYSEHWYPVTDGNRWEILPKGFQITLTQE